VIPSHSIPVLAAEVAALERERDALRAQLAEARQDVDRQLSEILRLDNARTAIHARAAAADALVRARDSKPGEPMHSELIDYIISYPEPLVKEKP